MPKDKYTKENASLETLLDLDGEIFPMENGYWTKLHRTNLNQQASF